MRYLIVFVCVNKTRERERVRENERHRKLQTPGKVCSKIEDIEWAYSAN